MGQHVIDAVIPIGTSWLLIRLTEAVAAIDLLSVE
jgi:hypothetical protein